MRQLSAPTRANVRADKRLELLLHRFAHLLQAVDLPQLLAGQIRWRQPQDAPCAGVGRQNRAVRVQHQHAGSQIVENGLQLRARSIQISQTAAGSLARIGQLLRHLRKRARQPAQFVARIVDVFGSQIAFCHLAHTRSQQQERSRQLRRDQGRQ